MNTLKAISTKRAIRKFEDKPLTEDEIKRILNAGRRAQSSKNMQPWNFVAITDKATLEALGGMGDGAGHLVGAAFAVAIITRPIEERFNIMFDSGQAAAYMQLAAWEMGIGSCLATIYQPEAARDLMGFPNDMHINVAISFGYPQPDELKPRLVKKDGRRDFEDVVHWEKW